MSNPDPTRLLIEIGRLNDRLNAASDALVADLGMTSARWQVMGAVATATGRVASATTHEAWEPELQSALDRHHAAADSRS